MPSCEKCWADAHRGPQFSVVEEYQRLLAERWRAGRVCTPEEQAGPDAKICQACGRRTLHQYAHVCMACGWEPPKKVG